MAPLPPPPDSPKRGRGRRTTVGSVPPLPSPLTPEDILRLTDPEAYERTLPPIAEAPKAEIDPTRLSVLENEEFKGVLYEIAARSREALKLFNPLPEQERFFASDCDERLAIGGNRGGKTTTTMVEIARAVTGQDPYDKYPKRDGVFILVAIDLSKCAKVFYRKLFLPGAFKVIKDLATGKWRTFNPETDSDRIEDARKAPPLIPPRFVEATSWENKKDLIPKTVRLKNGWELWFYSSGSEWPQGVDVDGVAFDEELERDGWYAEMSARLADRREKNSTTGKVKSGKFIWSATPQSGTAQLFELYSRAIEEREGREASLERGETPEPLTIDVFLFGIDTNPFIAEHAKDALKKKYANNEAEYKVRIEGDFALYGTRVYGDFTPKGVHGIDSFPVPEDWTSYAIVDPGRQVCAVLFFAIPPRNSQFAGQKIVYDMLYIQKCNAKIFAKEFVKRVNGRPIEIGIIDHRGGRITDIGSGESAENQYTKALKEEGFKFERGGTSFQWASDDVKGGIQAVQNALHIIDGKSELLVFRDKCHKLLWEMERYSYKKLPSGVVTDEPIKLNDHACDCLRYAFMANLKYVKPRQRKATKGYTTLYLEQKKLRAKHRDQKLYGGGSYKVG
ncbi:Phage terminase large subunit [Singulisphaera sp. GP187]|uniref:hypothetical protein n=1 Tax=Singulisphaera sp. GP187 TaxID=1882752 RepID=UPI00092843DC|nr:hypothetical protein [Singulisphaera sp. GP187]SIO37861.1 Phage terminase large subunit [Singulisphaera sp. GP187]